MMFHYRTDVPQQMENLESAQNTNAKDGEVMSGTYVRIVIARVYDCINNS